MCLTKLSSSTVSDLDQHSPCGAEISAPHCYLLSSCKPQNKCTLFPPLESHLPYGLELMSATSQPGGQNLCHEMEDVIFVTR